MKRKFPWFAGFIIAILLSWLSWSGVLFAQIAIWLLIAFVVGKLWLAKNSSVDKPSHVFALGGLIGLIGAGLGGLVLMAFT